jgi:Domain of unknown function (DUF4350)
VPLGLAKADRRLLMWAALIFVPLVLALALLSSGEADSGDPSSYSAQASGTKAAYLLLQDMGYTIERWERPPTDIITAGYAQGTVLVLANPSRPPSHEEKDALQSYLSYGGKILITDFAADFYLSQSEIQRELVTDPLGNEYQPQLVTSLTRGGAIRMSPTAYWKQCSTNCLVHYADDRFGSPRPIVVSYQVGKGQVIWWAASTPLNNGGISQAGNMELLLNSIGPAADNHVLWDEYFHSSQRTAGSYLKETPVLLGLAQGALAALALLLTYSRRNGPIYPADSPSRLSPLEFVETLGGLYRRAHVTRAALEVPYMRFRTLAARQLGLKTDIAAPELARAIRNRLGYKDDSLQDLLVRIETALYDPELQEAAALEMVQHLHSYARRLQLISFEQQEIVSHANRVPGAHARTN